MNSIQKHGNTLRLLSQRQSKSRGLQCACPGEVRTACRGSNAPAKGAASFLCCFYV